MKKFHTVTQSSEEPYNLTELYAANGLDNGYLGHADWMAHGARYGFIAQEVARNRPSTLLDVGCGRLQLPYFMWRNRRFLLDRYVGLDLRAREQWFDVVTFDKVDMDLVRMDIVKDAIPDELPQQYDVVCCLETFEHVPVDDQQNLLHRLYNWTKPDGVVYFSTPNLGGSDSVAANHIAPDGEVRERTYSDKLAMQRVAGFVVEESFGVFTTQKRVPKDIFEFDMVRQAKKFLPNSMFRVFIATAFPDVSNNSLQVLRRPK